MYSWVTYSRRPGAIGILAVLLALIGLLFFWMVPINLILGGAGVLVGVFGVGINYSAGGRPLRQATAGLLLALIVFLISLTLPLILREDSRTRVLDPRGAGFPAETQP